MSLQQRIRSWPLLLASVLVLFGCVEGDGGMLDPSAQSGGEVALSVVPEVEPTLATGTPGPLASLRLEATRTDTGEVVGQAERSVSEEDEGWTVDLQVEVSEGGMEVVVSIELMDEAGRVVWSGVTRPIGVRPGETPSTARVTLGRGSLANATVSALAIQEGEEELLEGEETAFQAEVEVGEGGDAEGVEVFWESTDPDVAVVDEEGRVEALEPGMADIVATAGRHQDERTLEVLPRVEALEMEPEEAELTALGEEVEFQVRAVDPRGDPVEGRALEWSVEDPEVLEELESGSYRAVGVGTSLVTVEVDGAEAAARVAVVQEVAEVMLSPGEVELTALGSTEGLAAEARDARDNPIEEEASAFQWSSSDEGVATVEDGVVTARGEGEAVVEAELSGESGRATVTVTQEVAEVVVAPSSFELMEGEERTLRGVARDRNQNVISGASPKWRSADRSVARVTDAGVVKALRPGTAVIEATVDTVTGSSSLTVKAEPVDQIQLVAGGSDGTVLLSQDGEGWTEVDPSPTGHSLFSGHWGGGRWVLGADDRTVISTSDGDEWVADSFGGEYGGAIRDLAWNGEEWRAVLDFPHGAILRSDDGVTWSPDALAPADGILTGIEWNGSHWVVVGEGNTLAWSTDGVNWVPGHLLEDLGPHFQDVRWNGQVWVALGLTGWGETVVAWSSDGAEWFGWSYESGELRALDWNGSYWVAVGDWGAILTSQDGKSWTEATIEYPPMPAGGEEIGIGVEAPDFRDVTWAGDQWVAVGMEGVVVRSTDPSGGTFQFVDSGTSEDLEAVAARERFQAPDAPSVSILSPEAEAVFSYGEEMTFEGEARDTDGQRIPDEEDDLEYQDRWLWRSDREEELGRGRLLVITANIEDMDSPFGDHRVYLSVTDDHGRVGLAAVNIFISC